MIKVFEAQHLSEAHLVCGLLQAAGIDAKIEGDNLASMVGTGIDVPGVLPKVCISDSSKSEQALALISRFQNGDSTLATAPSWVCIHCNETHESQFLSCWKCGASKPVSA
jgi:hypothetical protein